MSKNRSNRYLTRETPGVKVIKTATADVFSYRGSPANEYAHHLDTGALCNRLLECANDLESDNARGIPSVRKNIEDIREAVARIAHFSGLQLASQPFVSLKGSNNRQRALLIPPHDKRGEKYPGNIKPGEYTHQQLVNLLRKHRRRPAAIQFLADIME